MTAALIPTPIQKFWDNNGAPLASGKVFTYVVGTSTKQATWTDSTQTVPNTNPIILNARGEAPIWLDVAKAYKIVVSPSTDTDPPTAALQTTDNVTNPNSIVATVTQYGALGDGSTDDYAAFVAALAANQLVYIPPTVAGYRLSAGITVPAGCTLYSLAFTPSNPPAGARLIFDLGVTTCITMGGATAANGSARIFGFTVTRAAGAVPAGSIAVLNQNTYASSVDTICLTRHDIGLNLRGNQIAAGICCNITRLYTGIISDAHVVVDSWPETRIDSSRFGQNGGTDVPCNAFIRVQGGSTVNAGVGPNGLFLTNNQFNQSPGGSPPVAWITFVNRTPGAIGVPGFWQWCNNYVETVSNYITSDATWTTLPRVEISNNGFNSNVPFLALNAATQPSKWMISNNVFNCSFALAPAAAIDGLTLTGNDFIGLVSITGIGGSIANLIGNTYRGGLTLAGAFTICNVKGGAITGGSLTNTATGTYIDIYPDVSWTPGISIGGNPSTNQTYTRQVGNFKQVNNVGYAFYSIILSAVGADVGSVVINGLPVASNGANYAANTGSAPICGAFAGLTGCVKVSIGQGVTQAFLRQSGAAGDVNITQANLTATTSISGVIIYPL